jgi:hypothetical protein
LGQENNQEKEIQVNLDKLTPQMWEVIRTWEYDTLIKASMMFQPLDEEDNE